MPLLRLKLWIWIPPQSYIFLSIKRNTKEWTELGFRPVEQFCLFVFSFTFRVLRVRHWWPEQCHVIVPYGQQCGCPAWLVKMEQPQLNDVWLSLWITQSLVVLSIVFILHLALGRERKGHCRYYLVDRVKYLLWKKTPKNWMFLLEWKL